MRANEVVIGESYVVHGKGISLARVKVTKRHSSTTRSRGISFTAEVQEGMVYIGWRKNDGGLDMEYVGPGEPVLLNARDLLRTWKREMELRAQRQATRQEHTAVLAEMDALLNKLGLPNTLVQLVQTDGGPLAVTVMGIEEIRSVVELLEGERHAENPDLG